MSARTGNGPYLTIAQAARLTCVSESLLYEACRRRRLAHYRPGVNGRGKILILPADLDGWLANFKVAVDATGGAGDADDDGGMTFLT